MGLLWPSSSGSLTLAPHDDNTLLVTVPFEGCFSHCLIPRLLTKSATYTGAAKTRDLYGLAAHLASLTFSVTVRHPGYALSRNALERGSVRFCREPSMVASSPPGAVEWLTAR